MVPVIDHDVQGIRVEITKIDPGREILIHALMIGKDLLHYLYGPVYFIRGSVIGDRQIDNTSDMRSFANILDCLVCEFPVGNRDKMTFKGPYLG